MFSGIFGLLFLDQRESGALAASAAFLFLAALPWLRFQRPSRALALAGVMFSFALLFVASRPFTRAQVYPLVCTGRRRWCEIENLLFFFGGAPLAALPFALLGVGLLAFSIRAVRRLWSAR